MTSQRFTCVEDGASKFWEVGVEGVTLTVRYRKIGTDGQTPVTRGGPSRSGSGGTGRRR